MQLAEDFYAALFTPGEATVAERLSHAVAIETIYPPLLHLIGAALWIAAPFSTEAMAFAGTLAFVALLLGVYALMRRFRGPPVALLATAITGFTPFLFGASRLFIQDVLAAAFVVWTLYAAERTRGFQHAGWVVGLAALAGLGLLARWTTPLYYMAPAALIIAHAASPMFKHPETRKTCLIRIGRNAALLAAIGAALALPWYAARAGTLRAGYLTIFAGQQGQIAWTSLADWTVYLVYIINAGTFLPLFLLACAGLVAGLWRPRDRALTMMLVSWVCVAYLVLTATWEFKAPAPRYVIPILPAFSMAAALALAALPRGAWRITGIACALGVLGLQYTNLTVAPLGPVARIEVPILASHPATQTLGHSGLVVTRERVRASAARYFPAYRGENWLERVLDSIREDDQDRFERSLPRAQVALVRVPKVGLERLQRHYWPSHNPGLHTELFSEPIALRPLMPAPAHETPAAANPEDDLEVWFRRPKPVEAFRVVYEDPEAALVRFSPHYWDNSARRWVRLQTQGPPAETDESELLQAVFRVVTQGVRLIPTRASLEVRVEAIEWLAARFPERPPAVVAEGETITEVREDLANADYLVLANPEPRELQGVAREFRIIDQFKANLSTHWKPTEIVVLSRFAAPKG